MYSREVLDGLCALHPEQRFLWCYRPHRYLRGLREKVPRGCRRRLLWETGPPGCGLFHGLNQRMPRKRAKRSVVTFHDLFVMSGEYSTAEFREKFTRQAREAAERADLVICVSAFTASQVAGLLGVETGRLRVIWHGVHAPRMAPPAWEDREPMILHVGALQTRKNIARLVEAFEEMPGEWRLVLAGSAGYGAAEILERIERSEARARIEVTGYITDARLRELYRRAKMLVFPSLDEGFGIPLLEAMAYGVPIVTSKGSALGEVARDAAILVDPLRVDEIAGAMTRMASDEALRDEVVSRGISIAKRHGWQAAAHQT
ncbi:MAG: glycosyltransferase family 4 protein, partial [Bryobacterales bacterium]|nr:glycosyltransferase family 4 protein [Bryobacterales bacterium]